MSGPGGLRRPEAGTAVERPPALHFEQLRSSRMTAPRIALGIAGLVLLSVALRATALHGRYWIDEGLSVGIASHSLADIPSVLRADGSPPLYYMLLHVWISVFGDGEARTHMLSLLFALLTIPVAFFAGRTLFGERAGWCAAAVAALNPFLNYYAQETRMYSLVVLLSLLVAASFALAFVQRRRGWLAGFALSGAALIYTHNWGLFMIVGTAVALLPLLRAKTVPWRDALIGYGAIAVLYLPWLPTFLFQAKHTGAPWSRAPKLDKLPGDLAGLAGGPGPAVAVFLVVGSGFVAYVAARALGERERRESDAIVAVLVMILAALAVGFISSQSSPAWTTRYFAAIVGPTVLLLGAGLARARALGLVGLALLAALWLHPPTHRVNNKSDVHRVGYVVRPFVKPGDVIVSTQPEQVPVLHFYFPKGLRWADGIGWVKDPTYMDWRDALDRYRAAHPTTVAGRYIAALRPGQRLVLVQPIISTANWSAPWTSLIRRRAARWERVLGRDQRLVRERALPVLRGRRFPRGVRLVIYRRVG
jgi:mannosyltransferase